MAKTAMSIALSVAMVFGGVPTPALSEALEEAGLVQKSSEGEQKSTADQPAAGNTSVADDTSAATQSDEAAASTTAQSVAGGKADAASADAAADNGKAQETPQSKDDSTGQPSSQTDQTKSELLAASAQSVSDVQSVAGEQSAAAHDHEHAPAAFEQSLTIDNVEVTLQAESGVFPAGSTLKVEKASDEDAKRAVDAIESVRDKSREVAASYAYSVKVLDEAGNEVQPADGAHARLTFSAKEVSNDKLTTEAYLLKAEDDALVASAYDDVTKDGNKASVDADSLSLHSIVFTREPEKSYAFSQQAELDGVKIRVTADEGAFPNDASLYVRRVSEDDRQAARDAVTKTDDTKSGLTKEQYFDIKVVDSNRQELQPAEGYEVNVEFASEDIQKSAETKVFHIEGADADSLKAEPLDVTTTAGAVTAKTDGFSIYVLKASYSNKSYSIDPTTPVTLETVKRAVGISSSDTLDSITITDNGVFAVRTGAHRWYGKKTGTVASPSLGSLYVFANEEVADDSATGTIVFKYKHGEVYTLSISTQKLADTISVKSVVRGVDSGLRCGELLQVVVPSSVRGNVDASSLYYEYETVPYTGTTARQIQFGSSTSSFTGESTTNKTDTLGPGYARGGTGMSYFSVAGGAAFDTTVYAASGVRVYVYNESGGTLLGQAEIDLDKPDLSADITDILGTTDLVLKAGESKNMKQLLAEAGLVHIDCQNVKEPELTFTGQQSSAGVANVSGTTVKGVNTGWVEVEFSLVAHDYNTTQQKEYGCAYHPFQTYEGKVKVHVLNSATLTATQDGGTVKVTNATPGMKYTLTDASGKTYSATCPDDATELSIDIAGFDFGNQSNYQATVTEVGSDRTASVTIDKSKLHTHSWTYVLDANDSSKIVATCVGEGTCNVTGKALQIAAPTDLTYDNSFKAATITDRSILEAGLTAASISDISYVGVDGTSYNSATAPRNAGTYKAAVTVTPPAGSGSAVTAEVTYTIAKATTNKSTLTADQKPTAKTGLVYDTKAQELVTGPKQLPDGYDKVQYSTDGGTTWVDTLPTGTDADTYTVKVKYVGDSNHEDFEGDSLSVTIAKADIAPVVSVDAKTYDGSAVTPTLTGNPGNGSVTYTYEKQNGSTWETVSGAPKDAGTYRVTASVAETGNYNAGTSETAEFVISKANPTVTAPEPAVDLSYTGAPQQLIKTAGTTTGGTMQYSLDGTTWSTDIPKGTDKGTYFVYYRVVGDDNYNGTKANSFPVIIRPRELKKDDDYDFDEGVTLSPTEFTYNGSEQKPVVTVKLKDGTTLTEGTDFTVTYSDDSVNVGEKDATVEFVGNYFGTVVDKVYKINPKKLTASDVTFSGDTFTYSGAEQGPTITVKDGEKTLVKGTDYLVQNGTATDANAAGQHYTVTVTGSGNYAGSVTHDYTIGKATSDKTKLDEDQKPMAKTGLVYNGADQALVEKPIGSTPGYTVKYSLDGSTWTTTPPTGKDAKDYTVHVKYEGDANHEDFVGDDITVTIGKKAVTITPEAGQTKTYGESDPATFTYSESGVVSGEKLEGVLKRKTGENVGAYDFDVSDLANNAKNANYDIKLAEGAEKFSITKANQGDPEVPVLTATPDSVTVTNGKKDVTYTLYDENGNPVAGKVVTPTADGSFSFSGLDPNKKYTVKAQVVADDNHEASGVVEASITTPKEAQTAPTTPELQKGASSQTETDGEVKGVNDTMEYSTDGGATWTAVPTDATTISGLPAGETLVRYKGDDTKEPSPSAVVDVTFTMNGTVTWHYRYSYVDGDGNTQEGVVDDTGNQRSKYARVELYNGATKLDRTVLIDVSTTATGETASSSYDFNGLSTTDANGNPMSYRIEVIPLMAEDDTNKAPAYTTTYTDDAHLNAEISYTQDCFDATWTVNIAKADTTAGAVPDTVYVKVLYGTTAAGVDGGDINGYKVITQQATGNGTACTLTADGNGGYTATGSYPVWKTQPGNAGTYYHHVVVWGYQINGKFYDLSSKKIVSSTQPMTYNESTGAASHDMVVNISDLKIPMVEFDPNGGTISNGYLLVDATGANAGKVTVAQINAKVPTWEGHTFDGWYTEAKGGTKQTTDLTNVTEKKTLFAHWNMVIDVTKNAPTAKDLTYNGQAQELVVAPAELPAGCEKVRYSIDNGATWTDDLPKAVNAGTYTVKVKYVGDGTHADADGADVKVTIKPKPLTSTDVKATGKGTSLIYSGAVQGPSVTVTDGTTTLAEGTTSDPKDYTLASTTATTAGSYAVTVTGTGNYTGSVQVPYTIAPYELKDTDALVIGGVSDFTYNGKDQRPSNVTVALNGTSLREGADFEIAYPVASVDAGNYEITVTLKNNYKGTATKGYKIVPKGLTADMVTAAPNSFVFSGAAQGPSITVKDGTIAGGITLTKDADYLLTGETAVGVGDGYKAVISGTGNYIGKVEKPFSITPYEVTEKDKIDVSFGGGSAEESFTYNGADQRPSADAMTVTLTKADGTTVTLTKGTDFDVEYLTAAGTQITTVDGSKNAGTYQVRVALKGNYSGSASKGYAINPKPITAADVEFNGPSGFEYTYATQAGGDGMPQGPNETVTSQLSTGETNLVKDQDYTIADAPKTDAGTYTMLVKGTGNFCGEVSQVYTIKKATTNKDDLTNANKPTANKTDGKDGLVYNGGSQTLVTDPTTNPEGYVEVLYSTDGGTTWTRTPQGTDAGDYPVQVKYVGDKNHEDLTIDPITAKILKRELTITGQTDARAYNGAEQELTVADPERAINSSNPNVGLITGHSVSGLSYLAKGVAKGVYEGAFTPADGSQVAIVDANHDYANVAANYDIKLVTGKLTITAVEVTDDGTIDETGEGKSGDTTVISVTGKQGDNAPTYDGQPHKPVVQDMQAKDKDGNPSPKTLVEGTDYDVKYYAPADINPDGTVKSGAQELTPEEAGEKVAVVELKGDYSGTVKVRMDVAKRKVTFTGESATKKYNGAVQELTGITIGEDGLVSGHTHNLTYSAKGAAKSATAGDYAGTFSYGSDSAAVIKNGTEDVTKNYEITETPGKLTITAASVDENNDGTADDLTDDKGNTVVDENGKPVPIVSLEGTDGDTAPTYDDQDHKPVVKDNGYVNPTTGKRDPKTLVEGKDYTVAYYEANPDGTPNTEKPIDNTNGDAPKQAGDKVAVITFIGDYEGSLNVPVDVKKRVVTFAGKSATSHFDTSEQPLSRSTQRVAEGKPQGATMTPNDGKATTYTIEGSLADGHTTTPASEGAKDTVAYDATGTNAGVYPGTFTGEIKIFRADGATDVTKNYDVKTTTGTLTILQSELHNDGNGWGVIPGEYAPEHGNKVVHVEGKTGDDAPVYDGTAKDPVVTDKQTEHEQIVLTKGVDYDVAYYAPEDVGYVMDDQLGTDTKPQIKAGAHAITAEEAGDKVAVVTLKGNMAGTITAPMEVKKRPVTVTGDTGSKTYTGKEQKLTGYTPEEATYAAGAAVPSNDSGLLLGHKLTDFTYTAKGTNKGDYNGLFSPQLANRVVIMSGTVNVSSNYDVTLTPGKLTITQAKVDGDGNLVNDSGDHLDQDGNPTTDPTKYVKVVDVRGKDSDDAPVYDGTPKEPDVYDEAAEGGRKHLEKGTDYDVAYYEPEKDAEGKPTGKPDLTKPITGDDAAVDAGDKVAVVTLKGDYDGTINVPMDVRQRIVSFKGEVASVAFDGQPHTISGVTVGDDGLVRGHAHDVTYTATGTDKGEYGTDASAITAAGDVHITSGAKDVTKNYKVTTEPGRLTIGAMKVIDDGNGNAIEADRDGNPIKDEQGNPKVRVTVTLDYPSDNPPVYDGKPHAPKAHDTLLDEDLIEGEDYVVHYYEAKLDESGNPTGEPDLEKSLSAEDAGDRVAVVEFTKDYTGEVKRQAKVLQRPVTFTGKSEKKSYTGKRQTVEGYDPSAGDNQGLLTAEEFGHTTVVEGTDTVVAGASGTKAGTYDGTITATADVKIVDKFGNEQTRNYAITTKQGALTIDKTKVADGGNGKGYATDAEGVPVDDEGKPGKTGEDGKPVKDENGNPVDENGKPIQPTLDVEGTQGGDKPTYDGTPKEPVVTDNKATDEDGNPAPKTLEKGTDYDVEYFEPKRDEDGNVVTDEDGNLVPDTTKPADPADAGEKVAVVTLKGDYEGTVNVPMDVAKRPVTLAGDSASKTYNGNEQSVTTYAAKAATGNGGLLDGHEATGASYVAKGTTQGTYEGAFDLGGLKIVGAGGADVTKNYDVTTEPGKLTITKAKVVDNGNGGGVLAGDDGRPVDKDGKPTNDPSKQVKVIDSKGSDGDDAPVYDGTPKTPEVFDEQARDEDGNPKKLEEGKDYDVKYYDAKDIDESGKPKPGAKEVDPADAGDKVAVVTLKGDYEGTVNVPVDVKQRTLHVTTGSASKPYDGTPLTNDDDVKVDGLVEGQTVEVIVTGSQTEAGTSPNTYKVLFAGETEDQMSTQSESEGTPGVLEAIARFFSPTVALADESDGLAETGTATAKHGNYVVNQSEGTGTLTVTAASVGDKTGLPGEGKRIVVQPISSGDDTKDGPDSSVNNEGSYTGKPIAGPVLYDTAMKDENGQPKRLVEGTDYTVAYYDENGNALDGAPVDAGTYRMVVTYTGSYSGTYETTVTIAKAKLSVTTPSAEKAYDGQALTKSDGSTLDGLVNGETATLKVTGTQTQVGSSTNGYEIEWGTAKEKNYEVSEKLGTLTVTAAAAKAATSTTPAAPRTATPAAPRRSSLPKTSDDTLPALPLAVAAAIGAVLLAVGCSRRREGSRHEGKK